MIYFPQLTQFPIQKKRSQRTLVNEASDGTQFKSRDALPSVMEWQTPLKGLSSAERDAVVNTWLACHGPAGSFVYIDATENLLLWSEDFTKAAWSKGPDILPSGRSLVNTGQVRERIMQTLDVPAWFDYCLSFLVRGESPSACNALRVAGAEEMIVPFDLRPGWSRVILTSKSSSQAEQASFGVELQPGAAVEIAEMQLQAQIGNSIYKKTTTRNGIYRTARFASDQLVVLEEGEDDASVTVRITAREALT
jgi:hypothetical protein